MSVASGTVKILCHRYYEKQETKGNSDNVNLVSNAYLISPLHIAVFFWKS
jgi:hypothetical protein